MVSDRSYSAPMTLDQALAEAHACAGTQFDLDAVDALDALAARRRAHARGGARCTSRRV